MNDLPAGKNRRVLVIDDNRAIHEDFRKILAPVTSTAMALDATEAALFGAATAAFRPAQFEIDSAYQGQDGVLLVKKAFEAGQPYAVAFVDVRMPPGWDGVQTVRKMWELDPRLQVVLCTAYSDYSWDEMFEKLGHRDGLLILKKPFDAVEAFQLAHTLTEKWWLHQQSVRKMEELERRVAERTHELQQANHALQTEVVEHQRAEESLRLLGAAVQQAKETIVITDADLSPTGLKILFVNPAFTKMTGYTAEEAIGNTPRMLQGPRTDEAVLIRLRQNLERGEPFDGEAITYRKDGKEFNLEWQIAPIRDGAGKITHFVALQRDITARKQAEDALRVSDEKFHQLADHITDAFWIRSPDMLEVHYVSPAFEQIWGRSVASLYASPEKWADFIVSADRERVLAAFAALKGDAPSLDVEYRIARPDGEIRWVRVRGFQVRDAAGKLIRHTGIVTDITERHRAAEELRESERRFSDMLRNLELISMMLDQSAHITYCNDSLLRLTGWRLEEVLGRDWFEFFLPPERFPELKRVHAALLDDQPAAWHYENEIVTRSGGRRLIRWNNSVLRSAPGEVIGTASIGEDITERRHAEAALQSSEARKNAIVQSSLDCIVAINHEGRILEFNPAAEKLFGYARAEVLGREMAQVIIPPSLRERHRRGMVHYLATGEARVIGKRIEIVAMRSDGSEFPVELAITRMGVETPATFTSFIRDISERRRAERQLNLQYALSRVLAESSTAEQATPKILEVMCDNFGWEVSGLWSVDARAGVLRCVEIWGAPGLPTDEFKAASRRLTLAANIGLPGRVWATGQSAWIADVLQDGNFPRALAAKQAGLHAALAFPILIGSDISGVIEIFSREVRPPDEDLLRTFAILGSQLGQFFQRRRLEDQLFQSQKLETVGKLAGGIAHEFNSIMTAIIGQSELLLNDLPPGNPLSKNATEIRKAADRAATLTRQLLAYGRKQILQPEILDLNVVLAGMESTLRHLMGRGADVSIALAPGLKTIKADAGQVEQVIMNLVMNAADAMPHSGKLTLETANVTLDPEYARRFPDLQSGEYVMLAVTDNGTGMSAEVKARLFEPFFTTKGVGQGTGLGLSTCYGIIKQSGGHISVYSEPARGATFKIYLPQVELLAPPGSLSRLDAPEMARGTETILLVEDDPALREMAATLLRRLGYTVLAAANGIEALGVKQQRASGFIDLLFTDVVMPHMSGKELAERVRALNPHTRILFTSAYTEHATVHQGVLNPGVAMLQKPFTPSALAAKVRAVLDQPRGWEPGSDQEPLGFTPRADGVYTP